MTIKPRSSRKDLPGTLIDRLEMTNQINNAISSLQNFETILHLVFEQIQRHIHFDVFFIALYDEKTQIVSFPILWDSGKFWNEPSRNINQTSSVARAVESGQPTLLNRSEEEIEAARNSINRVGNEKQVAASILVVPLQAGARAIGALSIQSYQRQAYTPEHLTFLTSVAPQITVAIENARLFEEANTRARHLALLNEIGREISALRDMPTLLETVYEQMRKVLPTDLFFIGLYDAHKNEMTFPLMYDGGQRWEQNPSPVTETTFTGRALLSRQPLLINHWADPEQQAQSPLILVGDRSKTTTALMFAPMLAGQEMIGVISVQSYTPNTYTEAELTLLTGIANQVAIAIKNAELYATAQQELAERQKITEQLRAAEAKYRELIEHSPAVIYSSETGAEGRWFYVSPQIESLLGFAPEEWIADPHLWYRQIHPEDREHAVGVEAKAIAEGVRVEMEYRMITRDGQIRWIRDESLNVSVSDNQQVVVQGILTDITARKQAELDLRQSEEKYHSLFLTAERQARELSLLSEVQSSLARELDLPELMKTVVEATSKTFGYTFVSLYVLEEGDLILQNQVGYRQEHLIPKIPAGQGVSARVLGTGKSVLIQDASQEPHFLRGDPGIKSEISVPLFDGDRIFGTLNVESAAEVPLNENDLRLLNTLGEQVNMAIRKARLYAERAESLRREQTINEFAHAITSTLDLSAILEKVAKLSAQLIAADTATVTVMSEDGLSIENIYNYNEDPSLHVFLPRGKGMIWQVFETGVPVITDNYPELANAHPEWIASGVHAYMCFPVLMGGRKLGTLSLYNRNPDKKFSPRDYAMIEASAQEVAISIQNARLFATLQKELEERKRVEREREAMYQDLEAKNAELEKFTYTVSHDLKSPLVTIGGFLGYLEEDIKKGDEARVRAAIKRIHEAAVKMHRLLDELLELSRVGRLANPSVEVPFGELAREALEMVEGELAARQVQVRIEAGLPSVFVDRIRMVEVLQNLLVNAAKFIGDQPKPLIEIGMEVREGQPVFFVKDNGMGIAPEFHHKVFGLFDKLDPHSTGTGIGLALVKRIIEVHGGKIWVESERGRGATFLFTLKEKNH